MRVDLALVLALLAAAVAIFVADRPRMDAVGLLMIAALRMFGVSTMDKALAGFSDAGLFSRTPFGAPTLVVPGNSAFGDFMRIGAPFSPLVLLVAVLLVPLVAPLQ